jgi:ribokinase
MSGRVIVFGSINVDLIASVERLPSPGETIAGASLARSLGGKGANQAVAAACAGEVSILLGATGKDAEAELMTDMLASYGVNVDAVGRMDSPTGQALILTSPQENQIVVIAGANGLVDGSTATSVAIQGHDICLTQMETPADAAMTFFRKARAAGATTLLNAAPASEAVRPLLPLTDVLILNEGELELLSGRSIAGSAHDEQLIEAAAALGLPPAGIVIVTLGAQGVAVAQRGVLSRVAGQRVQVIDPTGAGDCFCGYLAAALARGDKLESAVVEANVAASIAVQSLGAASSVPLRPEVLQALVAVPRKGL